MCNDETIAPTIIYNSNKVPVWFSIWKEIVCEGSVEFISRSTDSWWQCNIVPKILPIPSILINWILSIAWTGNHATASPIKKAQTLELKLRSFILFLHRFRSTFISEHKTGNEIREISHDFLVLCMRDVRWTVDSL